MPSGKLPPERDLCEQIGVSRSTLRSALNLLEAEGKIWRRVGSGTYTGSTPPKELQGLPAISDATSPGELMELRLMIEPGIARLAALRATRSEIEYLKHCVAGADVRWPRLGTRNSARRHHRPSREYGSSHLKWGVDQVIQDNCGLGIPTRQPSDDLLSRTEKPSKRRRTVQTSSHDLESFARHGRCAAVDGVRKHGR